MLKDAFCIAICTRGRAELLNDCMISIADEITDIGGGHSIVVVENDSQPRSAVVVSDIKTKYPNLDISYCLEPKLGISSARNRALALGLASNADWIAFIDDDEVMSAGWLRAMLRAAKTMDAEVLTGPVRYCHELQPISCSSV
jgi:GT2 family glycosyltransferase